MNFFHINADGGIKLEDWMQCSYKRDQISPHLSAHRLEVGMIFSIYS